MDTNKNNFNRRSSCFNELFPYYSDFAENTGVAGNIRINIISPEYNTFTKYTAINDSEFVFSAGKGGMEFDIYTSNCKPHREFGVYYDSHELMHLSRGCGTNCWLDIFLDFYNDTIYTTSAWFVDTARHRFVEMSYDETTENSFTLYFHLVDIHNKARDSVKCNYYDFRSNGCPELHISNVKLNNGFPTKVSYSVY